MHESITRRSQGIGASGNMERYPTEVDNIRSRWRHYGLDDLQSMKIESIDNSFESSINFI